MSDNSSSSVDPSGRLAAFRYRDFRLFWLSLFISNIGTWMQMMATNWLLYELTDSPLKLGLNGVFRAVPAFALGVVSGTFADRYDRKRLMLVTQLVLAALSLGLGLLNYTGHIEAWQIYAFTFVSGAVGTFDGPARQALFPSLIPRAVLPNAVALNSLLWKGAALLGPSIGGIAISAMGMSGAFFANAASFLAVVAALMMMHTPSPAVEKRRDFVHETKAGLTYIASQPVILGLSVMEAASSLFGLDHAMLTILSRDIFQVGAQGFGFLQSARGLGAVIGSTLFIAMGQRGAQGTVLLISAILYGAGFALFGLAPNFAVALVLLAFVGATDSVWSATRGTMVQLITPERYRGRMMGVFQLSNRGLHPLGQMETGVVVPLIGAREATFAGGVFITVVTVLTAWWVPQIHRFRWADDRAAVSDGSKTQAGSSTNETVPEA
ncbi:MAG TPA: MFS transporter [Candidatus Binatia bacterium]|nr:MFS transporter [Candidatus Binatia bacterium]